MVKVKIGGFFRSRLPPWLYVSVVVVVIVEVVVVIEVVIVV